MLTLFNIASMMRFFNRGGLRDRLRDDGIWQGCWLYMRSGHIWPLVVGGILLIALVVGLALLISHLVRRNGKHAVSSGAAGSGGAGTVNPIQPEVSSAIRILDERFARGEINEEEYQRRKEILRKG